MSQDFVFINPQNIPPRRAAPKRKSVSKKRKLPRFLSREDMEAIGYGAEAEFGLPSEFYGQVVLSGSPPSSPAAYPEQDPLTEAIFGDQFVNKQFPATEIGSAKSLTSESEKDKAIDAVAAEPKKDEPLDQSQALAELEKINEADSKLSKKIARLVSSSRRAPLNIGRSGPLRNETSGNGGIAAPVEGARPRPNSNPGGVSIGANPEDVARAQDDWFRVGLANKPAGPREKLPHLRKNRSPETVLPNRDKFKTFLAGLAAVMIPLTFGLMIFSQRPNFVKTAIASLNNKFLSSTTSFTFINAKGSGIFVDLSETKESLFLTPGSDEAISLIDQFLEKNSGFSWLNIFKKKVLGSSSVGIVGLELLDQAGADLVSSTNGETAKLGQRLAQSVSFLNFWNKFLAADQTYAVVILDNDSPQPMGGRPESYAVFATASEGFKIVGSGKLADVDAALSVKMIPPAPLQAASTSWLPSEAGWFLDFGESAQTLLGFFEDVTQTKFDGLMAVSKDFLKSLSFKESLIFEADSPSWFYGLSEALSRKPDQRWVGLARSVEEGLSSHKIQFYFKNPDLEKFAVSQNWAVAADGSAESSQDTVGVSWFHFKGANPKLELIENKVTAFEDGSLVAKLVLNIKPEGGSDDAGSLDYFKIYLPSGVQVMAAEGFSKKEKAPAFDYSSSGFSRDGRVAMSSQVLSSKGLEKIDFFEESGWSVVGGWLSLDSVSRKSLSLEYLLPFRLDRKSSLANYNLKVWRPHQKEDALFRFSLSPASPDEGISVVSLKPDGFISEGAGEFQSGLSRDIVLSGTMVFPAE